MAKSQIVVDLYEDREGVHYSGLQKIGTGKQLTLKR